MTVPALAVLWEREKKFRYNCDALTSLLCNQVPVLEFVRWKVVAIDPGMAHTVLPLASPSTNQHCTHQAAVLFLAADYTGGIALASLLPGRPVVGVHPVTPMEKSIALWLIKGEIRYARPSVGRLEIVAEVDPRRHPRIRKRFSRGKPVLESITIHFRNGPVDVATAEMTYYARKSENLRADGVSPEKVNILYQHKLISSAELIAGVRAREHGTLFEDEHAARIAGEHGVALAARFCEKSPQLGGMVAARTRHLDLQILDFLRQGGRTLVILGAGYDMRPFRLNLPPDTKIYELDFPTVLKDRQERLDQLGVEDPAGIRRIPVPIDLETTALGDALEEHVDFTTPVFVAWEGMSMYFEEPEVKTILRGIAPVLENGNSRLWVDFVTEQAITSPEVFPEVEAFMAGMQLLGEPFIFGPKSIRDFMQSNGFQCHDVVSSDVFFTDRTDPVYSIYSFCVASPEAALPAGGPGGDATSWVVHPAQLAAEPALNHEAKVDQDAPPKGNGHTTRRSATP